MTRARTNFSKAVQRQAIARAAGQCEGLLPTGERCPCRLQPGRFQVDHILPGGLGGPSILANAQVLCTACHTLKTARDVERIAKAKRQADAHAGVQDPHARALPVGRPLPSARPACRASTPLSKPLPPRRPLYVPGRPSAGFRTRAGTRPSARKRAGCRVAAPRSRLLQRAELSPGVQISQ